jgi:hypothetical protein
LRASTPLLFAAHSLDTGTLCVRVAPGGPPHTWVYLTALIRACPHRVPPPVLFESARRHTECIDWHGFHAMIAPSVFVISPAWVV